MPNQANWLPPFQRVTLKAGDELNESKYVQQILKS